jgi:hypothetical protein
MLALKKGWLATLGKVNSYPNFNITPENVRKAKENFTKLQAQCSTSTPRSTFYPKEALDTAKKR